MPGAEAEHSLAVDNRIDGRERGQSARSASLEAHAGVESFTAWVRGEPAKALAGCLARPEVTWEAVHETLGRYGLAIRRRGAGLVVVDRARPS